MNIVVKPFCKTESIQNNNKWVVALDETHLLYIIVDPVEQVHQQNLQ